MRHLIALGAVLCSFQVTACTADGTSESTDRQSTAASNGNETSSETTAQSSSQLEIHPNVTTPSIEKTFLDGCKIRFWCQNNNAAGDLAGFCILNPCNGTAPAHAAAFCSNTCPARDCTSITNFGACGPG